MSPAIRGPSAVLALALALVGPQPSGAAEPAVRRGGDYMGFPERFNRYYTDPDWRPVAVIHVSPGGGGDGSSASSPLTPQEAVARAVPGTRIAFARGIYEGGLEFGPETSGTYDMPVVLTADRNSDGSIGVTINCAHGARLTCINLEGADYIAIDGFELVGGAYGIRAVGRGYDASAHARGLAALDNIGHDQTHDPFFTGQSDWAVFEGNLAYGAKEGDGHGFYISNGSDWTIARFNETFGNAASDFQINADPLSTCMEDGIAFDDPRCDAFAGEGEGGRGASDYMLIDSNVFHHGASSGANFTSVRRSMIRNNVFGPQDRHNVSFWQETDNPRLGSSENIVAHNLFISTGGHGVQFINESIGNRFVNNLLLGLSFDGGTAGPNPDAVLMEVDASGLKNVFEGNLYVSGRLEGRAPGTGEMARAGFSPAWFLAFPYRPRDGALGLTPAAIAPFGGSVMMTDHAPMDAKGTIRSLETDPGPYEGMR